MKRFLMVLVLALTWLVTALAAAQTTASVQTLKGPDERFKTDILVVVAHPDDEGGVTPYLARAIYDEHKRVAVVFATRGGSGGNDYSREHGPALADIREQEARQACAKLGITNVWFLEGKDTASQNVLNSLANWGHGANLEALVRIVRLTRPEVIISWLPGIFIGENHGDHQAAGVLATEAFDLAEDATAFPAQVAGASKRLEVYLENLTPWQPKKLYFFSDADDQKQFAGSGPAYSVKEISPSQKKPYWRLAMDAATPHLTQFPAEIHQLTAMSDEQLNKFMDDPQHQWWTEPMTLILGKVAEGTIDPGTRLYGVDTVAPVFPENESTSGQPRTISHTGELLESSNIELGGSWRYYSEFRYKHSFNVRLMPADGPEIAVKSGSVVQIPIVVTHEGPQELNLTVATPGGWKVVSGAGVVRLPAEFETALLLEVQAPPSSTSRPEPISITADHAGKKLGEVRLKVQLKASALSQN